MYPSQTESKRKLIVKPMSLPAVLQTERLFSSAIIKVILPFRACWCTKCMVRLHPSNWKSTQSSLEMYVEFAIRNIIMLAGITNLKYAVNFEFYICSSYYLTSCCNETKLVKAYSKKIIISCLNNNVFFGACGLKVG